VSSPRTPFRRLKQVTTALSRALAMPELTPLVIYEAQ
jgi:hypothetical protein